MKTTENLTLNEYSPVAELNNLKTEVLNLSLKMKIKQAINEAKKKNVKPYDENGRVNGGEWAKAIKIINKNISIKSEEGRKAWEVAFNKILSPKGQVVRGQGMIIKDGGSRERKLKDGTKVFLDNRLGSSEIGYITVRHADKTMEKFKPDGTQVFKINYGKGKSSEIIKRE